MFETVLQATSISASYGIGKKAHAPVHCGPSRGPPRHSAEPGHHARQAQRLWRQGRARARHADQLPRLRLQRPSTRLWSYALTPLERAMVMMNPIVYRTQHTSLCAVNYRRYHGYGHCKSSSRGSGLRVVDDSAQAEDEGGRARGWTARLRAVLA